MNNERDSDFIIYDGEIKNLEEELDEENQPYTYDETFDPNYRPPEESFETQTNKDKETIEEEVALDKSTQQEEFKKTQQKERGRKLAEINKQRKEKGIKKLSKSKKAGVLFPVDRIYKSLKSLHPHKIVSKQAAVYLAAVLEYLSSELLDLSGQAAIELKKKRIIPHYLMLAIDGDTELKKLLKDVTIAQGGVTPYVHPEILKTKPSRKKKQSHNNQEEKEKEEKAPETEKKKRGRKKKQVTEKEKKRIEKNKESEQEESNKENEEPENEREKEQEKEAEKEPAHIEKTQETDHIEMPIQDYEIESEKQPESSTSLLFGSQTQIQKKPEEIESIEPTQQHEIEIPETQSTQSSQSLIETTPVKPIQQLPGSFISIEPEPKTVDIILDTQTPIEIKRKRSHSSESQLPSEYESEEPERKKFKKLKEKRPKRSLSNEKSEKAYFEKFHRRFSEPSLINIFNENEQKVIKKFLEEIGKNVEIENSSESEKDHEESINQIPINIEETSYGEKRNFLHIESFFSAEASSTELIDNFIKSRSQSDPSLSAALRPIDTNIFNSTPKIQNQKKKF